MSPFVPILAASPDERAALFDETAIEMASEGRSIEKDCFVNLLLDVVFNRPADGVRLRFKGGTSLSLCHGLIRRFSEDVDVTVSREDLGAPDDEAVRQARDGSGRRHRAVLDEIARTCGAYVSGPLRETVVASLARVARDAGMPSDAFRVEVDPTEPHGQSLIVHYPSVFESEARPYVRSAVLLEAGARGSMGPHAPAEVGPYVNLLLGDGAVRVRGIDAIDPLRTFFEKVTALHAFRQTSGHKLLADRLSRHYYDLSEMWGNETLRERVLHEVELLDAVTDHKLLLFYRKSENLHLARRGTLTIAPDAELREALRKDYDRMSGMIFGVPPRFDDVMDGVAGIEAALNDAYELTASPP